MTTPVLLLLFNRPDLADRVFSSVREVKPSRLFIAVDGPRPEKEGEKDLVLKNRAFAEQVDWPCDVQTLFRDDNLGCGRAVSEAISWFFENVESGIILEDDCLPSSDFFSFSSEMLERYKDDDRIAMVNGTSYIQGKDIDGDSYYFSMFDMVWGWASWRRAWIHYDFSLSKYPHDPGVARMTKELSFLTRIHLKRIWRRIKEGKVDTWDYQWEHAIWSRESLVVTPVANMISNIGFDERATHTSSGDDGRAGRSFGAIDFPLSHPNAVERDTTRDRRYEKSRIMSLRVLFRIFMARVR